MEGQWVRKSLERRLIEFDRNTLRPKPVEHRRHGGIGGKLGAEHDVAAFALTLKARGEVDGRAEIIEPLVEGHDDARALMQAELDGDRIATVPDWMRAVEGRNLALDLDRSGEP